MNEMIEATDVPVRALQDAITELPQVECETEHYFADGMYCRVMQQRKDVLVVGKVHKREHFFMVVQGAVAVVQDGAERKVYRAPSILISPPGTKRALYALEDSIILTVHRTEKTDLAEVEADLVESDPTSPFGVGNQLKVLEHTS